MMPPLENQEPRLLNSPTPLRTSIVPDPTVPSTPSQPWLPLADESSTHDHRRAPENQSAVGQSGGGPESQADIPQSTTPRASSYRHRDYAKSHRPSLLSHVATTTTTTTTTSSGIFPPPPPPPPPPRPLSRPSSAYGRQDSSLLPPPPPDGQLVTPPTDGPAVFHPSPPPPPPSVHCDMTNPPARNGDGQIKPSPPRPIGEVKINSSVAPPPPPPPPNALLDVNIPPPPSPDALLSAATIPYYQPQNRPPAPSPNAHGLAPGSSDSYFAAPSTPAPAIGQPPSTEPSITTLPLPAYGLLAAHGPSRPPSVIPASPVNEFGFADPSRYPTPLHNARIHAALYEDERDDTTPTPRSLKLSKPPPPPEAIIADIQLPDQRLSIHPPGPQDAFIPPPPPPIAQTSLANHRNIPRPLSATKLDFIPPPSPPSPGAYPALDTPPPPDAHSTLDKQPAPSGGAFLVKPPPPPPPASHLSLNKIPPPPPPPFHPALDVTPSPPPPPPLVPHARFDVPPPPPPPDSYPELLDVPPPPPVSYTIDTDIPPPPPPPSAPVIILSRTPSHSVPPPPPWPATAHPLPSEGFSPLPIIDSPKKSAVSSLAKLSRDTSQRFNQYEHDEVDEFRKGEDYNFPPRGPANGPHDLDDKGAGPMFSIFRDIMKDEGENEPDFQPPAPDSSTEAVQMDKVRVAWKGLKSKRGQMYDLRGQMTRQRQRSRGLQEADSEASYQLASHVKKALANEDAGAVVEALAGVEGLYMDLQNARALFHESQAEYDELDRKLDMLEEEVAKQESLFFDLLKGPRTPNAPEEEKPALGLGQKLASSMPTDLLGISADISPISLPEMYLSLEDKVAEFNLCFEECHDLVSSHSRIMDDVEQRRSYNAYYEPDEFDQELLDNFAHDHARLEKAHADSRECVIQQIEACIKAGTMPDIAFIAPDILWILADRFPAQFRPWLNRQPCDTSQLAHDVDIDLTALTLGADITSTLRYPFLTAPECCLDSISDLVNTPNTRTLWKKGPPLPNLAGLIDQHAPPDVPVTKLGEGTAVGNWFMVTAWQEQQLRLSGLNAMLLEAAFRTHIGRRKRFSRAKWERRVLKTWYADETRASAGRYGVLAAPVTPPVSDERVSVAAKSVSVSVSVQGSVGSVGESFDDSSLGGVYCRVQEAEGGGELRAEEET